MRRSRFQTTLIDYKCGALVTFIIHMGPHYWEIICDEVRAEGWSVGWVGYTDPSGRLLWQADAHKDDGRRFIARAEHLAVAFAELQNMTRIEAIQTR